MSGKMKKYWAFNTAIVVMFCFCGLQCGLYQKYLSGPRDPEPLQPAPAGTVTIGGTGYDKISSIQENSNQGFIIGAYSDIFMTDKKGSVISSRSYTDPPFDSLGILLIHEKPDKEYLIVTGISIQNSNIYFKEILNSDESFNLLWRKKFEGIGRYFNDCGYCGSIFKINTAISVTPDQGFIVFGTDDTNVHENRNTWACKIGNSGDTIFLKEKLESSMNFFGSLIECVSDGYVVAATRNDIIFLMKIDLNGIVVWNKQLKVTFPTRNILAQSIKQNTDNGIVIAGGTNPATDAVRDAFIVKTDAEGNLLWSRNYDGSLDHKGSISDASAQSIVATSDGGIVVLGITTDSISLKESDVWLFKVNANGDTLWSRSFGGKNDDYGRCLAPTSDGGYIIGAETESYGAGKSDIWLIKTDSNGNIIPLNR
jgi:hypothetical protein